MNKEIASQPDAGKFRSIASIILILICIAVFLRYTDQLSAKAEIIARDRVISDIKHSLAMMLYDYTIKGQKESLRKFDQENPFVPLAIYRSLPANYRGVTVDLRVGETEGWYFVKKSKRLVFISKKGSRQYFLMRYIVENNVGRLKLERIAQGTS